MATAASKGTANFPWDLWKWVNARDVNDAPLRTLNAIACYAKPSGYAFPGLDVLAGDTGRGKSSVRRHIGYLVETGVLLKRSRGKQGGGRSSNGYLLPYRFASWDEFDAAMANRSTGEHIDEAKRSTDEHIGTAKRPTGEHIAPEESAHSGEAKCSLTAEQSAHPGEAKCSPGGHVTTSEEHQVSERQGRNNKRAYPAKKFRRELGKTKTQPQEMLQASDAVADEKKIRFLELAREHRERKSNGDA
jgi:hypothetical protein